MSNPTQILSTTVLKCGECRSLLIELNVIENTDYTANYLCDCWKCCGQSFVTEVKGTVLFAPASDQVEVKVINLDSFSDGSTLLHLKTKRIR